MHQEIDPLYDAFEHARAERPTLPLLTPAEDRRYAHEVRSRVLDLIEEVKLPSGAHTTFGADLRGRPYASGFAFGMIAQHEAQHDETMLWPPTNCGRAPAVLSAASPPAPAAAVGVAAEVHVPGGPFTMGASGEPVTK